MAVSNLESTLVLSPTNSLPAKKQTFANAAIILLPVIMIATLLVCISMQGAPAIDLSNLVAP
jgi:hypothetical protein